MRCCLTLCFYPHFAVSQLAPPATTAADHAFVRRRVVASAEFADFLREQLAPLGHLTMRRMFGKTGVFCEGVMFGMVTANTLYLRVDELNRSTFKEAEAHPPLNYLKHGSAIDLSFWRVPERLFDEPGEFVAWSRAALAAAHRVAARREHAPRKAHGRDRDA